MAKTSKNVLGVLLLAGALAFIGCAHRGSQEASDLQSQLNQKDQEIKALESSNQDKDMQLEQYKAKLGDQSSSASEASKPAPEDMLLPPKAKPGECYARVFIPPTYRTATEKVLVHEASERLDVIPAKYEWVEKKVLVTEASERLEVVPAKYQWVEEKYLVQEASTRMEQIPAKYDWKTETIVVKPAYSVWKKGRGPIEKVDNATGEIMCLVEIPAVYETVKKKVMVSSPSTRTVNIPAEYQTVRKKVMAKPPTTRKVEIPAVYKSVKVRKLASAPKERRIPISAEYRTVTKTEKVTEGNMEWRQILCETNVSADVITKIQMALQRAGYNPGDIDGVLGRQTHDAMKSYQQKKGLAVGELT
ncbi:MAG: peptidoglycan-binding protein, partial [Deltaproteobacteria bacterium]|nr:peptidoglycan-binding protein [Deltaproteobacteria bacterium]